MFVMFSEYHFSTYEEVAGKSYSLEIPYTVCQKYCLYYDASLVDLV